MKDLSKVSDTDLKGEYTRRFSMRPGEKFTNASRVATHLMALLSDERRETFVVLYLDRRNRLLETEVLFVGTVDHSAVHPREIIRSALLKDASSIICGLTTLRAILTQVRMTLISPTRSRRHAAF